MKPIIKKEDAIHYVNESDFIKFVNKNSDYNHNSLCDICREEVFSEFEKTYYSEPPTLEYHTQFAVKWVGAFFDVHPFMKKIMFVFDS